MDPNKTTDGAKQERKAKQGRAGKPYSFDTDKALALSEAGLSQADVARVVGVHSSQICRLLGKEDKTKGVLKLFDKSRVQFLQSIQLRGSAVAERVLDYYLNLSEQHFDALTGREKTELLAALNRITGTAFDKERLLTGLSTENIAISTFVRDAHAGGPPSSLHAAVEPPDKADIPSAADVIPAVAAPEVTDIPSDKPDKAHSEALPGDARAGTDAPATLGSPAVIPDKADRQEASSVG